MSESTESAQAADKIIHEDDESIAVISTEKPVEIATETMHGDIVQLVIDELKAAPDVWQKLSQNAQGLVIDRVQRRGGDAIKQAVYAIAAQGRDTVAADLEQITAKDGIKAVLTLSKNDPQRHSLLDAVGKPVLLVVASAAEFMGGEMPKAESEQLPLDGVDDTPVADNCPATVAEA